MTFKEYYILAENTRSKVDVNQLFKVYSVAFDNVQALTKYGQRSGQVIQKSYIANWSNGNSNWFCYYDPVKQGDIVKLDANQVLIPVKTLKLAKLIANFLPPLPLSAFSAENNPMLNTNDAQSISDYTEIKPQMSDKKAFFDRLLDALNSGKLQ